MTETAKKEGVLKLSSAAADKQLADVLLLRKKRFQSELTHEVTTRDTEEVR